MVIATQPALVAGGSTSWMRSPEGSEADRSGDSSSMRWRVEFATNFASLLHQSKSANGTSCRSQPSRVSTNATPGWLIQSSVTSLRDKSGRSARKLSSSAEVLTAGDSTRGGFKLIHRPEVQIPGHQYLNPIPLRLGDGWRGVDRAFQDFRHDILGGRGIDDDGAAAARGHGALHRPVDDGDQDRGAEALKEMPIDLAG